MAVAEPSVEFLDIGINLTHESYDRDRALVLERAFDAGVNRLILTGATLDSSQASADFAVQHPHKLYATAGIHPHHASQCSPEALDALSCLLARPEVVAAGECGLDYYRMIAPPEQQEAAFRAQIELAISAAKPLFLHCRDAHEDFLRIVKDYGSQLPRAVVHCFTGSVSQVVECLDHGLYIGITGWICDERRGHHLKEVVTKIPTDRLMIETDGPYLLPRDLSPKPRDRRNEPAFLPHIAATIAQARGQTLESLAAQTTGVAASFFGLPTAYE